MTPTSGQADEQDLIRKSQAGDVESFGKLFLRYESAVIRWAQGMVKGTDDAKDIAQDVFLKVFQGLPEFRGDSKFSVWLYRITYNLSMTYLDKIKKGGVSLDEAHAPDPVAPDPAATTFKEQMEERTLRALEELPPHYRMVLTFYFFNDMSYEEIANTLNIPLNTVKTHLHRAKELLRKRLETEG